MHFISIRIKRSHLRATMMVLFLAAFQHAAADNRTALQELVTEALRNNPEIQAASKEREAAEQRIGPAGTPDDPMLEAGLISVPTDSFRLDREDMTMKMIGLSQRFPYPGKLKLRQDVASREAQSLTYGYHETVNRVARDTKIAYFDLALVLESVRLAEKNRTVLEQFLKIAEGRYSVGQASQADVLKAQTQLSRMIEDLVKLARERPMFEAELARALGRKADIGAALPQPPLPELREARLALGELRDAALRERPQLLAQQTAIARAEKSVELMRKDAYPDFDVRFSYGQRDRMPDGTRRPDMVNLVVAINLPVWRERKINPRIAEAEAMRAQALSMFEAQRNELAMKLRQEVAAAEQNLRSARLYRSEILPQARLTVEAALSAYRVNRADVMTLLDSQMSVYNFEVAHAAAVVNYNKALAEIDLLTGKSATGFPEAKQ